MSEILTSISGQVLLNSAWATAARSAAGGWVALAFAALALVFRTSGDRPASGARHTAFGIQWRQSGAAVAGRATDTNGGGSNGLGV
jgi:hypothetical protein